MKITLAVRRNYALMSQLYRPTVKRPKGTQPQNEISSLSQRLMLDYGLMYYAGGKGTFQLLPTAIKALTKLVNEIDKIMADLGAQKVALSTLLPKSLMEKSGRYGAMAGDLFHLTDRLETEYCLAPTHEEPITKLLVDSGYALSANSFPLSLYQMTNKFRDERSPRFGLLRSREFLMKDLYTFDVDEESCLKSYVRICDGYKRLFEKLLLPARQVRATSGAMGGVYSHEFHLENSCGQDEIVYCDLCSTGKNVELLNETDKLSDNLIHDVCGQPMKKLRTTEVAHTFVLGTKYTEAFEAFYAGIAGERKLLHMACFGIGVSRLLAACIDCLSQNMQIRWPLLIAPYKVCVIPPKKGSKEESYATPLAMDLVESLTSCFSPDDVILDDRTDLTVGNRLRDVRNIGFPYVIVVNKTAVTDCVPKFEFHDLMNDTIAIVTHEELFAMLRFLEL